MGDRAEVERSTAWHTGRGEADTRVSERMAGVVLTKLQPPLLRADAISRQRLLDRLRGMLSSHPLTLISAPAGYGKTTLLAMAPLAFPTLPLAWLSLDEEDNDPARFLGAVVAALQRLNPDCGVNAEMLLFNLDDPGSETRRIIGTLINEIMDAMREPFVLVLDDLHVITEPEIYAALDYLIERLPPQMHLAVASRHDPPLALARLRARRQLAELRLSDLRFIPEEVDRYLNGTLNLGLSPEHLAVLQDRMEGWAAGIGLTASSLDRDPSPVGRDAFVARLARTDRDIFEFLAGEVFTAQEPAVREFLLKTSILTELTPALCSAVTGRDDAPALLEELYRRNLFVVAVDRPGETFRYHDLFKEFLTGQLERETGEEEIRVLHRRAAEAATAPSHTVRHYLAAQMWTEAANVIEQTGEELLLQGSFDTLQGWIGALPEAVREAHPRLAYLLGRLAWMKWELDDARRFLERALEGFEATGDETVQGDILVHLATCLSGMGDAEGVVTVTRRALALPIPPHQRARALVALAWTELFGGNWVQTNAHLDAALALAEESGDPRVPRTMALQTHAPFTVLPGGVQRAERLCRLIEAQIEDETDPLGVWLQAHTAYVCLWRGRLDAAVQSGERALEIGESFGLLWPIVEVGAVLPVCYALRGDHATADRHFDALFRRLDGRAIAGSGTEPWRAGHLYLLGRTRWLQGRLEEAREIYTRMRAAETAREFSLAPIMRQMMRSLLHFSDRRYADAERLLRQADELQHEVRYSTFFGSASLLLAHLYLILDRPGDALATAEPVLAEHEEQGTPGFILWEGGVMVPLLRLAVVRGVHQEFAAQVLDLFGTAPDARPVRVPETGQTLTSREIEVLRFMAEGLTDAQVAGRLYISPRTVGQHLRSIYRKLGVPSRTAAARRADELGLI